MRQFFIIGHNPNKVADAINCLRAGANALEPDVHSVVNGEYFMGEGTTSTDLSLSSYLNGLSHAFRTEPELIPALIMFDTKNSDGSIGRLFDCINANFSNEFSDTVITVTRSQATEDEHAFFGAGASAMVSNNAFGVDEHTEPEFADAFFKSINVKNYTYADGISIEVPLLADFFIGRIKRAVALRDGGGSFKLIYAWTLDLPLEIHQFLNANPDGLITDSPRFLKEILTNDFSDKFELAKVGYNPFK